MLLGIGAATANGKQIIEFQKAAILSQAGFSTDLDGVLPQRCAAATGQALWQHVSQCKPWRIHFCPNNNCGL